MATAASTISITGGASEEAPLPDASSSSLLKKEDRWDGEELEEEPEELEEEELPDVSGAMSGEAPEEAVETGEPLVVDTGE